MEFAAQLGTEAYRDFGSTLTQEVVFLQLVPAE